jgi:hypothetical protein
MVAAARIVADGGIVHRDAFAMYGPIVTWLQALEFKVAANSLVGLRLGSALVLAVSAALFFAIWRRLYGRLVAYVASMVWVLSAPFVLGVFDLIPWNSDYLLLLQAASLTLLLHRRELVIGRITFSSMSLAGAGIGAMCLIRVTSGIATIFITLAVLAVQRRNRDIVRLIAGIAIAVFSLLMVLLVQGALPDWWQQFVIFPRQEFLGQRGPSGFNNLWNAIVGMGIPSLGLLLLARDLDSWAATATSRVGKGVAVGLIVISFVFLVLSTDIRNFVSSERLYWSIVLVSPVLFLKFVDMSSRQGLATQGRSDDWFSWAIGFASLSQLFPLTDYRHMWWAILPLFGPALSQIIPVEASKRKATLVVGLFIIPVGISATSGIQQRFEKRYFTFDQPQVLKYMYVDKEFANAFRDRIEVIKQFESLVGPRTVLNVCSDGLFATFGSEMKYPDAGTVVWSGFNSPELDATRREFVNQEQPFIWFCPPAVMAGNSPSSPSVDTLVPDGYRLIRRTACLDGVGGYDDWPLLSYLAVPTSWGELPLEAQLESPAACEENQ